MHLVHDAGDCSTVVILNPSLGKSGELRQLLGGLCKEIRCEPGCLRVALHASASEQEPIELRVDWRRGEDQARFFRTEWMQVLVGAASLLSEAPDFRLILEEHPAGAGRPSLSRVWDIESVRSAISSEEGPGSARGEGGLQ